MANELVKLSTGRFACGLLQKGCRKKERSQGKSGRFEQINYRQKKETAEKY